MDNAEPGRARRRPRAWLWVALGAVVAAALVADPWGWWRDEQWFFDGPERVDRWSKKRDAAQAEWHRHLMAEVEGPNAGPALAAAGAVASLAQAEWQGKEWPRVMDVDLDDDTLQAMRGLTQNAEVRYLLELLQRNRGVEYIHYAWMHHPGTLKYAQPPADGLERFPGVLTLGRILTVQALVFAADNEIDRAFETLGLGLVVARWAVRGQPTMLTGLLAASTARTSLRNIEELYQRRPPSPDVEERLRIEIEQIAAALDIATILDGEMAFREWVYTEEMDIWDPEPNYANRVNRLIHQVVVRDPPWTRDDTVLATKVESVGTMLSPETVSIIDTVIESQFRARLTLAAMRLLRGGALDLEADVWTDPFTGRPITSTRSNGACAVYSIGRDRKDGGGVDRRTRTPYWDVVWRLPCELIPDSVHGSPAGEVEGD